MNTLRRIYLLYFYPVHFIIGIVVPVIFSLVALYYSNVEIITLKWIIYFGCCYYLLFIGIKHHHKNNIQYHLDLIELQALSFLLDDVGIYGELKKNNNEIIYRLKRQNDQKYE